MRLTALCRCVSVALERKFVVLPDFLLKETTIRESGESELFEITFPGMEIAGNCSLTFWNHSRRRKSKR